MATKNDKVVQELFAKVQEKKKEITKAEKPNWNTNCSFGFVKESSQRCNIQTISDIDDLIEIFAFLVDKSAAFDKACSLLEVKDRTFKWLGFTLEEWQTDIRTRITRIQITKKKQELESLEKRLDSLVSPELRAELELKAISEALG